MEWFIAIAVLLILGLIVGAIAKFLMPGDDPGGIVVTSLLGVVGAILGGWIASVLEIGGITGLDWRSLVTAVGGSLLLLLAYRAFRMLSPGAASPSYASGRPTSTSSPRPHEAGDDEPYSGTNLADIAKGSMTAEVVRTLSEKTGEGSGQTRKALEALIPTVLASVSHHASTASGANQLFDLAKGVAQSGLDRHLADGDLEAVGRQSQGFLHMLFGDRLNGLLNWLARFAGIKESSASTLTTAASGLVMSVLGKTILQKGLDPSSFGRLLSSQAGWLSRLLPSGIGDVPGMSALADLGNRATQAGHATVDAGRRVGATAKGAYRETVGAAREVPSLLSALAPLALLLLPLLAFIWLMRGAASKIEQPNVDMARRTVPAVDTPDVRIPEPAKPNAEVVATTTNRAVVPTSATLREIKLPGGVSLKLPGSSFLNAVYGYLTDTTATQGRAFVFDGLEFDDAAIRVQPETETAIANLTTLLGAFPTVTLRIDGHTDPSGNPAADQQRSLARAKALQDLLVKAGVPAERIKTQGFGSEKPVADNTTPEGRAKNRRIELSLSKSS